MKIVVTLVLKQLMKLSLMEVGFFWSIFFAPWGPVLRYLGWVLFIVGFIFFRKKEFHPVISMPSRLIMLIVLIWGALTTAGGADSFYQWGKGFSQVMECCFGIYMASRVFSFPRNIQRFQYVIQGSVVLCAIWTVIRFFLFSELGGPFSNINILGLFSILTFPFCMSAFWRTSTYKLVYLLNLISFGSVIGMLVLSFSSSAWGAALISSTCIFLCSVKGSLSLRRLFLTILLVSFVFIGTGKVLLSIECLNNNFSREFTQMSSVFNTKDLNKFTNHRADIWLGAIKMIKMKPFTGWGWQQLRYHFKDVNADWWELEIDPIEAHNLYLELIVNGGFINLLLFAVLLYLVLSGLLTGFQGKEYRSFLNGCLGVILGQLVFSLVGNVFFSRDIACIFWSVLGFALVSGSGGENFLDFSEDTRKPVESSLA